MTSNQKNYPNIVFFPGLNQAPGSFIFSNPNVKYISLSFNKKARPNLKEDCERIKEVFKANPTAHIVAHSLSALLIEWLIQHDVIEVGDRKITYVAPAFIPRNKLAKLVGKVAKGPAAILPIPSLAPIKTRVRSYVSLGVYREIILLNEKIELKKCLRKVVVDKKDEMLNVKFLGKLPNIEMVRENRFPHHRAYDSLKRIIDQTS
ncbi:hypothetical protein BALOs_1628 [Halobacteriovorax sp. BALOs_7]|uniref:alpha/beta hydrolase n=1 Tax=Halobacteriovorax sp. BALOs_7 TaxID=2109558 RepID=UPI000EB751A7|nr:alpha/beta hydrolase [Halobacteriovorax sp. BALOs_7]AYF44628.1 hypothetical protein BALOs_1628 [Halobacteriovorax sp. BALOs_7]